MFVVAFSRFHAEWICFVFFTLLIFFHWFLSLIFRFRISQNNIGKILIKCVFLVVVVVQRKYRVFLEKLECRKALVKCTGTNKTKDYMLYTCVFKKYAACGSIFSVIIEYEFFNTRFIRFSSIWLFLGSPKTSISYINM